ncbi:hypothetical protein KAR91_00815 [Candidatus Pacearchaeota archaeon]|nr:hypothetical protein [Candidatus Pacearchaeota archaeon]
MIELIVSAHNAEELANFLEYRLIQLIREGYLSGYNWTLEGEEEETEKDE